MKLLQLARASMALVGCSLALGAWALGDRPVRLIVPAPPGGTMDIVARVLGQQMAVDIGRPVIVENRPGAGGSIGLQAMLQAAPDGTTIVVAASNVLAETPQVMKMPFDPLKDVVPIASVARSGVVLVTTSGYPAKDFQGLVAQLKTRQGKASFASYSPGTVSQYAGLILSDRAGLDMQHVGYPGSPLALQDLLGGQVDIMFDGMVTSMPLIKGGKLRPYAFSGKRRSRFLPDVPTTAELGYPELQFQGWVGFIGSSKLPADVLAKLHATIEKAAQAPAVQQKLMDVGLEPELSVDTPALLGETRALSERNAAIVKKFGIQAN
ncbi:tripartite tricarboxylate transporter substrate binding protein [Variovorax sp. J22P240]|uniref:Bug family tripartite tricarboxylate transporter substrate binding protein n=1 Tax=unclassified Variovorax TaxID=663243 RepID=UPI002577BE08|nr:MULTISPECIES: tripartite tricarboxylate transporter substrate binding protein [unclassified Variovorax]MDM0001955.1 tripartite tricarboxylate transporter substrate binding protein [Variovorax sp. J22P240]MDM0047639.1 tripartite tricarboxylate transporter substrate binding protein [Variovorax sp. J22R115]